MTPVVADGFVWRETPAGTCLVALPLENVAAHVFTTRDLSFSGGPADPDHDRLGLVFGVAGGDVVRVRQVHGRGVLLVRRGESLPTWPEADAIVTVDPTRPVAIRVADCVPILIGDRRGRAVAAVHAGWRGTAAGACGAAVQALHTLGVAPADLIAAVGPSVGPCCYQVDRPVRDAMAASHAEGTRWFSADGPERWRLDLWTATRDQLFAAGLRPDAVHEARLCTAHHPEVCYSFRARAEAGRMVAAIGLRSAVRT